MFEIYIKDGEKTIKYIEIKNDINSKGVIKVISSIYLKECPNCKIEVIERSK